MLKKAKKILIGSVGKPATQSDSNPAEASSPGSTQEVPASADAVSELTAASAATSLDVRVPTSITSASSAAKPATEQLDLSAPASESLTLTLPDVLSQLIGESLQADARELLQDIPVLQEWQRARNPGHKIRDAMVKLGRLWGVSSTVQGKKRPPAEVAQEIEENMLKKAKNIRIGSAADRAPPPQTLSLIHN